MYPIYHFIFSIVLSGFLWPLLGWKLALFWLGSFFIDVDHYWWEIIKTRDFSFKRAYTNCKLKSNGFIKSFDFHVFHIVEFWILMGIWSFFSELGFIIFLGVVFHNVIDLIYGIINYDKKFDGRPLSIFEWIYSPSNSTKV